MPKTLDPETVRAIVVQELCAAIEPFVRAQALGLFYLVTRDPATGVITRVAAGDATGCEQFVIWEPPASGRDAFRPAERPVTSVLRR